MIIKVGGVDKSVGPSNLAIISETLSLSTFPKLITSEKMKELDGGITTAENELTTVKADFVSDKNPTTEKALKTAEKNLKDAKLFKETELKGKETKIKVEAYFTKNKGKTKVQKDFTVTANGIN